MTTELELLGTVTCASGALMVVDFGLLGLWSHERPPVLEEWMAAPEVVAAANTASDYRVEGGDADIACRLFGRGPRCLYDRGSGFAAAFADKIAEAGLDARLVEIERVPHRARVGRALAASGSGVVEFHGIWAPCLAGIPRDVPMQVHGARMKKGGFDGRWSHVELRVRDGEVATTEALDEVPVDKARLGFFDVDAIGAWRHDEPIDGRADFVFWGRDAEAVAREQGAFSLGDGCYGWQDMAVEEIVRRGEAVEALRGTGGRLFATDFRPHSHHFQMMAQVRGSQTESGVLSLAGESVCGFMTTWGDGLFPVEIDRDSVGEVLAVRILLGTDQAIANLREVTS